MISWKTKFFILLLTWMHLSVSAQTLFTYGDKEVSKEEFMRAYSKNSDGQKPTKQSLTDYLELYTKFRIKVQAAMDLGYDTLDHIKNDFQNFREQMLPSFMNDEHSLDMLTKEIIDHAQKDILLAHIFIDGDFTTDSGIKTAQARADEVYNKLLGGTNFETLALQYSADPAVKQNKGVIGYISALSLPYDLEKLAYGTPKGKFSKPLRSTSGFHIFKNMDERPAAGNRLAAHILLAFPPGADEVFKESIRKRADSIYTALKRGADFGLLAKTLSDDIYTLEAGGNLEPFGIGIYDPVFEKAVYALKKDNDISPPVLTNYGYHIIKRLAAIPPPSAGNKEDYLQVRARVENSPDRMEISRKVLISDIKQKASFKLLPFDRTEFNKSTRAFLDGSKQEQNSIKPGTGLFMLQDQTITFSDWLNTVDLIRGSRNLNTNDQIEEAFNEFVDEKALLYYQQNLEKLNPEFRKLLDEFREGNLLFEVMQQKVWEAAIEDSAGLHKYYTSNLKKYFWEHSADVLIFRVTADSLIDIVQGAIKQDPAQWQDLAQKHNGNIQADSGRFELSQLPVKKEEKLSVKKFTDPVIQPEDGSQSMVYIIKMYNNREQKNFEDARGMVISDYQNHLEDEWLTELSRKYPVKINQKLFDEMVAEVSK